MAEENPSIPKTFPTREDAGNYLRKSHPGLSTKHSGAKIWDMARRKFPEQYGDWVVEEDQAQGFMESLESLVDNVEGYLNEDGFLPFMGRNAAQAIMPGVLDVPNEMRDFQMGAADGATLGASTGIQSLLGIQPERRDTGLLSTYTAGQAAGEFIGPGKLVNNAMRSIKWGKAALEGGATGAAAVAGGLENMGITAGRNLLSGDWANMPFDLATSFTFGAAPTAGLVAGRKGVEKWLKPGKEGIAGQVMEWFQRQGLPYTPKQVRPYGQEGPQMMEDLMMKNQRHRAALQKVEKRFVRTMMNMRDTMLGKMGNRAYIESTLKTGQTIHRALDNNVARLKEHTDAAYKAIRDTDIGNMPIDPNWKYTRQWTKDGVDLAETGSLKQSVRSLQDKLSEMVDEPTRNALQKVIDEVEDSFKIVDQPTAIPANRSYKIESIVNAPPEQAALRQAVSGGERDAARYVSEPTIVQKSYDWWMDRVQRVGDLFDRPNLGDREHALVSRVYATLQDHIDAQAAANFIDETTGEFSYQPMMDVARAWHQRRVQVGENKWLRKILDTKGKGGVVDHERLVREAFTSPDHIYQAKELLGPEVYDQVRQVWLRDKLIPAIDYDKSGAIRDFDAQRFLDDLKKMGYERDGSDFFEVMFSDEGFVDDLGNAIQGPSSRAKLAQLEDFVKTAEVVADARAAGIEGAATGMVDPLHTTPSGKWNIMLAVKQALKQKAAQIILNQKGANVYLNQNPKTNPFLGGDVPANILGGDRQALRAGTGAGLNRLLGLNDETERR